MNRAPTVTDRFYLFLTVLLVLVFFSPALNKTFIFRDAFNLFYPYKAVEAPFLRSFSVSLWDPYEVLGSPFVGELATSWFYPGNIFYMLFPVGIAFRLFIVAHFVLAAVFMWLWLREFKISGAAAGMGALSFTLSGYLLSQHGLPDMLAACAWLPGSLWFLSRWLRNRRLHWFLFFSASLAMPFLAGRAESVIIAGMICSFWILFSKDAGEKMQTRLLTFLKIMPPAGLLALALAMVQFLPSLELGRLSQKGAGLSLDEATLWSFHPARLLEFIRPSPWGPFFIEDSYFKGADYTGWAGHYPWSLSAYIGIFILAAAVVQWFKISRSKRVWFLAGLIFITLFAMGRYSFLYPLAYKFIPTMRIFRYPEKYLVINVFLLVSLGAWGLDSIINYFQPTSARKFRALILGAGLLLFIGVLWRFPLSSVQINPDGEGDDVFGVVVFSRGEFMFPVIFLFLACIALFRPRFFRVWLFLLALTDLFLFQPWLVAWASPDIFSSEPAALSVIRDYDRANPSGIYNTEGKARPGKFRVLREEVKEPGPISRLSPGAYDLERYRRWEFNTLMPNFNFLYGLEDLTGYTAAFTTDFDLFMRTNLNRKSMELFNVRYVISPDRGSPLERENLPVAGARHDYGCKVFVLPDAFPRSYLIGRSLRYPKVMDHLADVGTHDFRQSVILEEDPRLPAPEQESDLGLTPAEVISYQPEEVKIKASAPTAGYLVLSDSFYPGWRAEVDGRPAPIFRANYLVRAVWLSAGAHEVVFNYRPASYLAGRAISLVAVVLVLLGLAVSFIQKWPTGLSAPHPED